MAAKSAKRMLFGNAGAFLLELTTGMLCMGPSVALGAALVIVTEDAPPLNMVGPDGRITGIATDLFRKALDEAKISYSITAYPWARAYSMAENTPYTCVYSTSWTEQRAPLFKWIGPFVTDGWALFGRPESPKLSSLEDAREAVIGGYFGGASTVYLKQLGFKVDETRDNFLNLKKLGTHRIDYWVDGILAANYVARRAGVHELVQVVRFKDVRLGIACNMTVPDETIGKLNDIVGRMLQDGTYAAILREYE